MDYPHVGEIKETKEIDIKPYQWRKRRISITTLVAWFPLLVIVLWIIVWVFLITQPRNGENLKEGKNMKVIRVEKIKCRFGQDKHFTGTVQIDEIIKIPPPTGVKVYRVFFEPGARTAWHSHPEGQVLHVVAGNGLVKKWKGKFDEIRPVDSVYIAPGEKHWHGATPKSFMIHYAISPVSTDKDTNWMEKVTDEQYSKGMS